MQKQDPDSKPVISINSYEEVGDETRDLPVSHRPARLEYTVEDKQKRHFLK